MDIHYYVDSLTLKNVEKSEKMRKKYRKKRYLTSLHSHLFFIRGKNQNQFTKTAIPQLFFLYDLSNLITNMKDNTLNHRVLKQKKILDWVFLVLDDSFRTNNWQSYREHGVLEQPARGQEVKASPQGRESVLCTTVTLCY